MYHGKSVNAQCARSPASFSGTPLQILSCTFGVEHLSASTWSSSEIFFGSRTHARSCSFETIHTARVRVSVCARGAMGGRTVRLLLGPIKELLDHVDGAVERLDTGKVDLAGGQ